MEPEQSPKNSVIASRGSGVAIQGPCAWITSP